MQTNKMRFFGAMVGGTRPERLDPQWLFVQAFADTSFLQLGSRRARKTRLSNNLGCGLAQAIHDGEPQAFFPEPQHHRAIGHLRIEGAEHVVQ